MKTTVIVSTYNQPELLEKALWGWNAQTVKSFEIVVADDGSGEDTRKMTDRIFRETGLNIIHTWQPDEGFQKSRILNKAIAVSSGEYLVFSDGDCIPRRDFLETHVREARQGRFLSGGYFKLPPDISQTISREGILKGLPFKPDWLRSQGMKWSLKFLKLTAGGANARVLNTVTPTRPTWNGHNASGWKEDLVAVNGFNENMQYGGQDRELGERLVNKGLRGLQIRCSAVCLHLDHPRGYATPGSIAKNRAIRRRTRQKKSVWTEHGIVKKRR